MADFTQKLTYPTSLSVTPIIWNDGGDISYYDNTSLSYKTATLRIGVKVGAMYNTTNARWYLTGIDIYAYIKWPSGANPLSNTSYNFVQFTGGTHTASGMTSVQGVTMAVNTSTKYNLATFKSTYTSSNPLKIATISTGAAMNYANTNNLIQNEYLSAITETIKINYTYASNYSIWSGTTTKSGSTSWSAKWTFGGLKNRVRYYNNGWSGTLPTTPQYISAAQNFTVEGFTSITSKKTNCDGQTYTASFAFWVPPGYKDMDIDDIKKAYQYKVGDTFKATQDLYAMCGYPSGKLVFKGNGATSGSQASKTYTVRSSSESKISLPSTTGFKRTGYTFAGWYTAATGGTKYTQMTNGIAAKTYTFYAHWTPNSYVITFNKQSGTGGTDNCTIVYDTTDPLPTITAPTRTGYTFMGYYTSTGGAGVQRLDGSCNWVNTTNTTFTGATTLYAYWVALPEDSYIVTYANGQATSGTVPSLQVKTKDVALTLATNTGSLAKASTVASTNVYLYFNANGGTVNNTPKVTSKDVTTPYTMDGWATTSTGARAYTLGGSYTTNADITLYPHFTAGTATTTYGSITIDETPTKTNATFLGWYTAASGGTCVATAAQTAAGLSYQMNASRDGTTLYAHWNEPSNTIKYYRGSTLLATDTKPQGASIQIRGAMEQPIGYIQTGWNTNSGGTGTAYNFGQVYTTNANLTLYAIDQAIPAEDMYVWWDPSLATGVDGPRLVYDPGSTDDGPRVTYLP